MRVRCCERELSVHPSIVIFGVYAVIGQEFERGVHAFLCRDIALAVRAMDDRDQLCRPLAGQSSPDTDALAAAAAALIGAALALPLGVPDVPSLVPDRAEVLDVGQLIGLHDIGVLQIVSW